MPPPLRDPAQDNSTSPLVSDFGDSTVQLMVGSTYEQYVIANLTTLDPSTRSKYQASVDASAGGNSTDYFIRIRSNGDDALMSFSSKFRLASMTGSFTEAEESAISVGLASAASSSAATKSASSSSARKTTAIATSLTSASTTSGSATATKANKAAETTIPAASGAQRVGLSAGAAVVAAGALALLA